MGSAGELTGRKSFFFFFFTMIESAMLIGTVKKEKIRTENRSEDFFDIDLLGDIWIAMILNT